MKVDVSFEFAKVYDVTRIDVVKGQQFSLLTDWISKSKWFSDADEVLEIKVKDNNAEVKALELGTSVVWIVDENKTTLKELIISVVGSIEPQATALNLSAQ
jgi:hypothetical protein